MVKRERTHTLSNIYRKVTRYIYESTDSEGKGVEEMEGEMAEREKRKVQRAYTSPPRPASSGQASACEEEVSGERGGRCTSFLVPYPLSQSSFFSAFFPRRLLFFYMMMEPFLLLADIFKAEE